MFRSIFEIGRGLPLQNPLASKNSFFSTNLCYNTRMASR